MKKFISILLFPLLAFGALSDVDRQEILHKNLLGVYSGGFENGKAGWVASGGSFAIASSGSNLLIGKGSATWDSSAASQTLTSKAVAIPNGLKGRNGVAQCVIMTPSGTATHKLQAYDGTNILSSVDVVSSTTPSKNSTNFIFPSSGNIQLRLISVASDEPSITIDECHLGAANNLIDVSQATKIGSAYFPATTNCSWTRTNTAMGAFGTDADCPGPTVEFNNGPAIIQTTDTDLPKITVNNLPPGDYTVIVSNTEIQSSLSNTYCLSLNDGTDTRGNTCFNPAGLVAMAIPVVGNFRYSTAGNRTFEIFGSAASGTITLENQFETHKMTFTIFRTPLASEQAFFPDIYPWKVDANVGGANADISTTDVSTYSAIESTGLDIVTNTGSVPVKIPCSATNPPTGSTCSVGNESVGVNFDIPRAGSVRACASFSHQLNPNGANSTYTAFQIVETPNNAQTILQEGKSRISNRVGDTDTQLNWATQICGTFEFTSAGNKTLRLYYEADQLGSGATSNFLEIDRDANRGQNDLHWEVYPIDQQIPAPILVGNSVYARAYVTTSQNVTATDTIINFNTIDFESNSGSVTTGSSWKFTAPFAGVYSIQAQVRFTNLTGGTDFNIQLRKNNTQINRAIGWVNEDNGSIQNATMNDLVQMAVGDFIDIRVSSGDASIDSDAGSAGDRRNWISIHKVGN